MDDVPQEPEKQPADDGSTPNPPAAPGPFDDPFHSVLTTGLLYLFSGGNDDALRHFLDVEGAKLLRYIDRRLPPHVRGPIDTDDILQEVVIALAKKRDSGDLEVINTPAFRGLVRKITDRVISKELEKAHAKKRDISRKASPGRMGRGESTGAGNPLDRVPADGDPPSMEVRRSEQLELLTSCLSEMTPEEVEIIDMKHRMELDHANIAERLGISVEAARQRFHRAIDHLRELLRRKYPDIS